jgi:hypothetical protein
VQLRDPCGPAPTLNFRERQVIAAVVRKNEIADEFSLIGDYFTDPSCRRIFETAAIHLERGAHFDEYALAPDLEPIVRSHLIAMMEELAGDFGLIGTYVSGLRSDYLKRGGARYRRIARRRDWIKRRARGNHRRRPISARRTAGGAWFSSNVPGWRCRGPRRKGGYRGKVLWCPARGKNRDRRPGRNPTANARGSIDCRRRRH